MDSFYPAISAIAVLTASKPVLGCVRSIELPDVCKSLDAGLAITHRRLNSYNIVNYNSADRTVPRSEAAATMQHILDGVDNFEIAVGTSVSGTIYDGTADQMTYELTNGTVDGPFSLHGRFLQSQPYAWYQVDCPALTDGSTCGVKPTDEWISSIGGCLIEDEATITDKCKDETYTIMFNLVKEHHFVISASSPIIDCPSLAFVSFDGGKHTIRFNPFNVDVPSHILGKATLGNTLKAVANSPALTRGEFNFETNTCVHYAGNVWRELELDETDSLAEFIINHLLVCPSVEEHLKQNFGSGLRYLVAKAGGKRALKRYIEDLVYSQLNIV